MEAFRYVIIYLLLTHYYSEPILKDAFYGETIPDSLQCQSINTLFDLAVSEMEQLPLFSGHPTLSGANT